MPNGLLLIDKPDGMRSADCVDRARRALGRGVRVGHAGTLDSTASGLLVLLVGAATRLSDDVMSLPKRYSATVALGRTTDTCDRSGQTIFEGDASCVGDDDIDRALLSFLGWRMQRPPEISALKIGGRPAHALARAGQDVALAPRPIFVRSITRASPVADGQVSIDVMCGKGTYVRSLARDLGERLGCGASLSSLRRLTIGPFDVGKASSLADAEALTLGELPLMSPREVVRAFQRIDLTADAEARLLHGQGVPMAEAGRCVSGAVASGRRIHVEGRRMIGTAERREAYGVVMLEPRMNLLLDDEDIARGAEA